MLQYGFTFWENELADQILLRNVAGVRDVLNRPTASDRVARSVWKGGPIFSYRQAPLHRAASDGLTDILKMALESKADPNSRVRWEFEGFEVEESLLDCAQRNG